MSPRARRLRLGTRGSTLARIQSGLVATRLEQRGFTVELVPIVTAGDIRPRDLPWGEGAFVGALETALRAGTIDLAVHSAKDVPIEPEEDLIIAAYPERADPRDALITRDGRSLAELERGATVGTDSPRRTGFLRALRPDLRPVPLHGNVDTRLERLDAGQVDALVLAVAGLERLARVDRIAEVLPLERVPTAPGQGALAVQVRARDERVRDAIRVIDRHAVRAPVTFERAVLDAFGGGCRAPLGVSASLAPADGRLTIVAGAVEPDGTGCRIETSTADADDAGAARALGLLLRAPSGVAS